MEDEAKTHRSPSKDIAAIGNEEVESKNGGQTPNDSEAETEILPGSQKPTPRKKPRVKDELSEDNITASKHEQDAEMDTVGGEDESSISVERTNASRKRKAAQGPDAINGQQSQVTNGYHSDAKVTSSKKARLSSPEEQEEQLDLSSSGEKSDTSEESGSGDEDIRAGRRRPRARKITPPHLRKHTSRGESGRRAYNFRHPNDNNVLRISTSAQPTTSPSSPTHTHPASAALHPRSPYLRSSHRRSSSFHATALDGVDEMAHHYTARRFASSASVGERESSCRSVSQPAPGGSKKIDRSGRTALARACNSGDLEKVKSMLKASPAGLEVDRPDNTGNTALQIAALAGYIEIVEMLLAHGCDVNTVNDEGDTPLQDAMDNGHDDVVALLKAAGARVKEEIQTKPNVTRQQPKNSYLYMDITVANLVKAIKNNDIKTVEYFLQSVQPNNECLVAAIEGQISELPSLLLAQKADPSPPMHKLAPEQKTPIVAAIECGNNGAIQLLLDHGVNPNDLVPGTRLTHDKYCQEKKASGWKQAYSMLVKAGGGTDDINAADSDGEMIFSEDEHPKDIAMASPPPASKSSSMSDPDPTAIPSRSKRKRSPFPKHDLSKTKPPTPMPTPPQNEPTPTPPKEPTPPPPVPTEAELAAARAKEHEDYLQTLPIGLASLLGTPHKPRSLFVESNPPARSLTNFLPFYGVRLTSLGSLMAMDEIYVPSLYAALILGVPTLPAMRAMLDRSTAISMNSEHKEEFWRRKRLADILCSTSDFTYDIKTGVVTGRPLPVEDQLKKFLKLDWEWHPLRELRALGVARGIETADMKCGVWHAGKHVAYA